MPIEPKATGFFDENIVKTKTAVYRLERSFLDDIQTQIRITRPDDPSFEASTAELGLAGLTSLFGQDMPMSVDVEGFWVPSTSTLLVKNILNPDGTATAAL